jgi:hypothetical protein
VTGGESGGAEGFAVTATVRRRGCGHARVVFGDPFLELELESRLLGHPMVELRPCVADHVADQDAEEEAAEHRREAVVRRDRPRRT